MKISFLTRIITWQLPLWLVFPLFGVLFFSGIGVGYAGFSYFIPASYCTDSEEVCEQFGVFWQVWQLSREKFVDPTTAQPESMIEGAINGMLDSLGDHGHTRFLSAESAQRWDQSLSGEFEGIGAYLDMEDGHPIVASPIRGSPAETAGIHAGDIILTVNGKDTNGLTIEEVAEQVRGPKGTTVELRLRRPGVEDVLTIAVKRDRVELPSVTWYMLPDDIALVKLDSFTQHAARDMDAALREAQQHGARGIIFDLRNNTGGLVNQAITIASEFLAEGTPIFIEQERDGKRTTTRAESGGVALDIPMVVLINYYTASSAEIVSGALQDAHRAQLIGVNTVGTGTVLTPYQLEGGAKLLLGTLQWLTPEGRLIREKGIMPDIEIALPAETTPFMPLDTPDATRITAETVQASNDVQLFKAVEQLQEQINTP